METKQSYTNLEVFLPEYEAAVTLAAPFSREELALLDKARALVAQLAEQSRACPGWQRSITLFFDIPEGMKLAHRQPVVDRMRRQLQFYIFLTNPEGGGYEGEEKRLFAVQMCKILEDFLKEVEKLES